MKKYLIIMLLAFTLPAKAATVWDWSFGGEAGQFVTDGSGAGPGTYTLTDFSVTTSAAGATIGSLLGGGYSDGPFVTLLPYSFAYDGSAVTGWFHSGTNLFDWWTFDDLSSDINYLFGWDTGNINDPTRAALDLGDDFTSGYDVSVVGAEGVSEVPVPAAIFMFVPALLGFMGLRRRAKNIAS